MKDLENNINSPGRSNFKNRNWSIDSSRESYRDSQERDRR